MACGLDPVELRVRNEPEVDPETGQPWSSRHLVRLPARGRRAVRLGPTATRRRRPPEGDWLVGTGVACVDLPRLSRMPGRRRRSASRRRPVRRRDRRRRHRHRHLDGADPDRRRRAGRARSSTSRLRIGDTALPSASVAGGSSGISSWGSAIVAAARAFREKHGADPADGDETDGEVGTATNPDDEHAAMHAFGAQFAEVRVHADTGEIRVPRMLGVFAVGPDHQPHDRRARSSSAA